VRHGLQPLADLKAGGTGLAVNEDLGHLFFLWGVLPPTVSPESGFVHCSMIKSAPERPA
jgi:hypothetical protein